MRDIRTLLVATLALGLISCADMQASFEAGLAKARASIAAANDSCRFALGSDYRDNPIRHTSMYTGNEVCAKPESIANYDRRGQVIRDMCSTGSCWRNAKKNQFTPGVCEVYERLATRSEYNGGQRVDVNALYLTQTQKHGAIIAYRKQVKFDEEYATAYALDATEIFALEAHVLCQEWYQELAQAREREKKKREQVARLEAERERAQIAAAQAKYEASGQKEAELICEAWSVETLMQQQIDRDKKAEAISGVVNLATRHKAANTIVFMRERRKVATATYRQKTGKSINLAQCQI